MFVSFDIYIDLFILFFGYFREKIGKYFGHFSHNHLNDYYHSLPFYLFGIHSLILPLIPLQLSVYGLLSCQLLLSVFPQFQFFLFLAFHYIPSLFYKIYWFSFFLFMSHESCLDLILIFVGMRAYQADHHITPMQQIFSCK